MKFIQVTDLHMVPGGGTVHDLDPAERLAACIADVNRNGKDAAFCVFTGDLADRGEAGAYAALRECLEKLAIPYHLMLGNHDARSPFFSIFKDAPRDEHGYLQFELEHVGRRFLFLDTLDEGERTGLCCDKRLGWLADRLEDAGSRDVYLFMHHPPFDIGIPSMDDIRLADVEPFAEVVRERDNIRHLFFGHVHRVVSGSWHGIPYSALPSTAHQIGADFVNVSPMPYAQGPAAYAIVHLEVDRVVVHTKFVD